MAALVPVDPADLSDLQDDRTDNPAQDEDGAGEVVPDDVDERVVHFKELLPSQIVSSCPKMKTLHSLFWVVNLCEELRYVFGHQMKVLFEDLCN